MLKLINKKLQELKDKIYDRDFEAGFKEALGCYFNREITLSELAKYQHSLDAFDRGVCKAIRVIHSLNLPDSYN